MMDLEHRARSMVLEARHNTLSLLDDRILSRSRCPKTPRRSPYGQYIGSVLDQSLEKGPPSRFLKETSAKDVGLSGKP